MSAGSINLLVLGALPRTAAAAKLREIGEDQAAEALERAVPALARMAAADWWPFDDNARAFVQKAEQIVQSPRKHAYLMLVLVLLFHGHRYKRDGQWI